MFIIIIIKLHKNKIIRKILNMFFGNILFFNIVVSLYIFF